MAERVWDELKKEIFDWFPERSKFCNRLTAHEFISANCVFISLHKINIFFVGKNIFTRIFGGQFQLNVQKNRREKRKQMLTFCPISENDKTHQFISRLKRANHRCSQIKRLWRSVWRPLGVQWMARRLISSAMFLSLSFTQCGWVKLVVSDT